ncbi:hypothetical protein FACS189413_17270 [Bacteroidia bacterium]|nr:hypothetical protein FACS189413_17270 [Bacteroidia bacterium]
MRLYKRTRTLRFTQTKLTIAQEELEVGDKGWLYFFEGNVAAVACLAHLPNRLIFNRISPFCALLLFNM